VAALWRKDSGLARAGLEGVSRRKGFGGHTILSFILAYNTTIEIVMALFLLQSGNIAAKFNGLLRLTENSTCNQIVNVGYILRRAKCMGVIS
jgi:hypothetical protein